MKKNTLSNFQLNETTFTSYLKTNKFIYKFIVFFLGEVSVTVLFNDTILNKNIFTFLEHKVNLSTFLLIVIFLIFLLYILFEYFFIMTKKAKEQHNDYKALVTEYKNMIYELKTSESIVKGDDLFYLAMALDNYEPVKFDLLNEAIEKYHHVNSGIYLGNLYHSGLSRGAKTVVEKSYEKAYDIYEKVSKYDTSGMVLWKMGWMYERGQIKQELSETERKAKALEFYLSSAKCEYPKAYNSLGKFNQFGFGVLPKNRFEAIKYYALADELHDTYATLNKAYIHCEVEQEYPLAEECFKKAIKTGSPLANFKFGNFIENNLNYFADKYSLDDILGLYTKAAISNNGQDAARAYVSIGKLIRKHPELLERNENLPTILSLVKSEDFSEACFSKAYDILQYLVNIDVKLNDTGKALHQSLKRNP